MIPMSTLYLAVSLPVPDYKHFLDRVGDLDACSCLGTVHTALWEQPSLGFAAASEELLPQDWTPYTLLPDLPQAEGSCGDKRTRRWSECREGEVVGEGEGGGGRGVEKEEGVGGGGSSAGI